MRRHLSASEAGRDTSRVPAASLAVVGLLYGLLCGSLPAVSQSAAEPAGDDPAEGFFDVVEVEIVNIDVFVTDKKGNPVDGLGKDDFVVYRDGKPIPVANFYAVSEGRPAAAGPAPEVDSPDLDRELSPIEIAPEHRLWMIVYIDNYNIEPLERNRIFPALRQFFGQALHAGDQAMIVTYQRSLEVRQPFTEDVHMLIDSLDEIKDDAGFAALRNRDRMLTFKEIDETDSANQAMMRARQYAEEQRNGVQYTVDALERLIDSLGGLPGRKVLLHVSSGVPMAAGEEMFHAVAEKFGKSEAYGEIPRHDTSRSFEKVNRQANAHRVAFYTVDAGGLRGLEFGNAEYGGFVNPRLRSVLDSVVPENLQAPLHLMALETGGKTILNQNEILPALVKASQDFRSFYALGISSDGADAGRYHKIEVKLSGSRKGLVLRHRAGYRSKSTDTHVRESLRSALLYSHQANPLDVEVTWGHPEPYGRDGNYLLAFQLHIPLRSVVLLPTRAGQHEVRLQLFVGAVGEQGSTSEIDSAPLGVRLADEHVEAARKESLLHTHKLILSPGRKKVGVAIFDAFGRETSVVTRSFQVGPAEDG